MADKLTITLTDAPPVKIDRDLWPMIASAREGETEANNGRWIKVLQHHLNTDGRVIVYAADTTENPERRGGKIVNQRHTVAAIKEVAASLGFSEELAQRCIATLPPVEI